MEDIEIVDDFLPEKQNPHEDRITAILQKRAQPAPNMVTPQEMDIYGISSIASRKGSQNYLAALEGLQNQRTQDHYAQQDRELQGAQSLYDMFETKRARGDKQAQALFDKVSLFTGNDPEGMAMFVEALHNDPDKIDPSNSFQVMTKLAGIAKRSGYVSPEAQMAKLDLEGKKLGNRKTQKEIDGLDGPAKPQSALGKLAADRAAGLLDEDTYKAAVDKQTGRAGPSKPLPVGALRLQNEALDIIGTASTINDRMSKKVQQIEDGKLVLGPIKNIAGEARNLAGRSTEKSRNLASFKSDLEKMRNDSLRLNKGVQTEGDAQRAWNEILKNINDEQLVKQRLIEVQELNSRAVELRKLEVDAIRSNYGLDPLDTTGFEQPVQFPQEAVDELLNDSSPEAMAEFDEIFGEGAASSALGE